MRNLRRHERKRVEGTLPLRLVEVGSDADIAYIPFDISKQGIGVIVPHGLTASSRFMFIHLSNESIELKLLWIDYDPHEIRYRCGFMVTDENFDLEEFASRPV